MQKSEMRPDEEWRDIPGWESYYQASSEGRIRSVERTVLTSHGQHRRRIGRILRQSPSNVGGYPIVQLCRAAKPKAATVHRLVCLAFHGLPSEERPLVAHNDGTRDNNRADNLRWASRAENNADRRKHGTAGGGWRISEETARAIKRRLARGDRQRDIMLDLGVERWTVGHIARGKSWSLLEV